MTGMTILYRIKLYTGAATMPTPNDPKSKQRPVDAAEHVASAHTLLKELQKKVGDHPELGEAITKLEMALSTLAVKTGGLL
jgi:hypothetical protein